MEAPLELISIEKGLNSLNRPIKVYKFKVLEYKQINDKSYTNSGLFGHDNIVTLLDGRFPITGYNRGRDYVFKYTDSYNKDHYKMGIIIGHDCIRAEIGCCIAVKQTRVNFGGTRRHRGRRSTRRRSTRKRS